MRSRPLMTLRLSTAPTQTVGAGPHGTRLTFPIAGGVFDGDRLRGKVLPGGDDWVVKRPDGTVRPFASRSRAYAKLTTRT
jgi:hypothetical protein